jgi:uncharacterized protein YdhG (YjbR/CyaY superfamily)
MVQSADEYLETLPEHRRTVMEEVRKLIRQNLPKGYEEAFNWNMLCYQIPLERYPDTYNKQPIGYVALAAQKNYCALYLMGVYADPKQRQALEDAFAKAGKKMDMGKSCLRFKTTDALPLAALEKLIASTPPEKMIALYETVKPPKKKREVR